METNQLRSFMEVVKTGNFSEAAENLYTTQSSVSKHIQALEKDLGVKLFDRSKRKVSLTTAGQLVAKDAKRILAAEQHLLQSLASFSQQTDGQLSLASIPTMGSYGITDLIMDFQKEHPDLAVDLCEVEGVDILNRLQNDEFDLACMRTDHLPKSFDCLTLCQDHLVAVLPQTHPLANRAEISLSDLQEEDFLCLGADTKLLETVQTACHNAGFAPHITYTGNRAENIMDMVANGRGIALIMEKIATYYAKDRVALVSLQEKTTSRIGLVRSHSHGKNLASSTLWNYVRSQTS